MEKRISQQWLAKAILQPGDYILFAPVDSAKDIQTDPGGVCSGVFGAWITDPLRVGVEDAKMRIDDINGEGESEVIQYAVFYTESDWTPVEQLAKKIPAKLTAKYVKSVMDAQTIRDETPGGPYKDADTILADYFNLAAAAPEVSGNAMEILHIWETAKDKRAVEALFEALLGVPFIEWLVESFNVLHASGMVHVHETAEPICITKAYPTIAGVRIKITFSNKVGLWGCDGKYYDRVSGLDSTIVDGQKAGDFLQSVRYRLENDDATSEGRQLLPENIGLTDDSFREFYIIGGKTFRLFNEEAAEHLFKSHSTSVLRYDIENAWKPTEIILLEYAGPIFSKDIRGNEVYALELCADEMDSGYVKEVFRRAAQHWKHCCPGASGRNRGKIREAIPSPFTDTNGLVLCAGCGSDVGNLDVCPHCGATLDSTRWNTGEYCC